MKVLFLKSGMVAFAFAQCPHTPPPDPRWWRTCLSWDYECLDLGWVSGGRVLEELTDPEEWILPLTPNGGHFLRTEA